LRTFRSLALAAISLLPATLVADTPATTQWVVTSAKATGRGGELFQTSLRIVNPNTTAAPVDLYFLPRTDLVSNSALGDNSGAAKVSVSVPASQTLALDDVLASTFGVTGSGGIRVEAPGTDGQGRPLAVWVLSQTLVTNALSSTGVPGTNGFAIPSQNQDQLIAVGETAFVPYVSASSSSTSGYRTNLFLLSANATVNTSVTVALRKADGTQVGSSDILLGKLSQTQINDIAGFFGYGPSGSETNLTALVTVKSGGPVATGASITDNAIASISYAPPVKVPVANNGAYGLILDDNFGFSGRAEIVDGAFDYLSAGIVIPSCAGSATLFFIQGFGDSSFGVPVNVTFTKNADGSTSFSGTMRDSSNAIASTFIGRILTKHDGSIFGTLTYQRGASPGGDPCPAALVTFPFAGAKGAVIP
ncbi:MAG TPA: hypothetical protein VFZ57_02420, partial [Thermoanaerobaculia bacterium]|nr:hypothetical protein [Thermoanaerobaculia bacterium]